MNNQDSLAMRNSNLHAVLVLKIFQGFPSEDCEILFTLSVCLAKHFLFGWHTHKPQSSSGQFFRNFRGKKKQQISTLMRFYKTRQTSSYCLKVCLKQRPLCDYVPTTKCHFLIKPTQKIKHCLKRQFSFSAIGNISFFLRDVLSLLKEHYTLWLTNLTTSQWNFFQV